MEAGERLGFLPGDLMAKVDPYLRPLFDALNDMMDPERVATHLEKGVIEVAPLAFMRGRTLNDSFVILDEAQNTTPEQMKMFLTRLGFGSRMVVTGDVTQVDLPRDQKSGLIVVGDILKDGRGRRVRALRRRRRRPAQARPAHRRGVRPARHGPAQRAAPGTTNRLSRARSRRDRQRAPRGARRGGRRLRGRLGRDQGRARGRLLRRRPERIAELNLTWRGKVGPDRRAVSFPIDEDDEDPFGERELGDVFICPEHTVDLMEAVVHGVLHLTGMDHETDEGEMLALQAEIMGWLR